MSDEKSDYVFKSIVVLILITFLTPADIVNSINSGDISTIISSTTKHIRATYSFQLIYGLDTTILEDDKYTYRYTPDGIIKSSKPVHTIEKAPPSRYVNNLTYNINDGSITFNDRRVVYTYSSGNSMIPTMNTDRSRVIVVPARDRWNEIVEGDIVSYKQPDAKYGTMHRVIWRNNTHFIAKGDNNYFNDTIQPIEYVEYIVVAIVY